MAESPCHHEGTYFGEYGMGFD